MNDSDFKYMKEALTTDLAELLLTDFGMSISDSLDAVYNSETYAKLIDPNTGLFFQSSQYVYSFLRNEITQGRIS